MWYHPTGIANILSLSRVMSLFRVTYDSDLDNVFRVDLPNGRIQKYTESYNGLYFSNLIDEYFVDTFLVNTVEYNKTKYSHRDYLKAVDARKLQSIIGNPI